MQEFSATVASHVRFLLQSLNGSNSDSVLQELCQFTEQGLEGSLLILQSLLEFMNVHGTDAKKVHLHPVISSVFRFILDKPNFSTVLCQSLRMFTIRDGFLDDLSNALGLSLSEKIAIGLAFSESENPDARLIGTNFCMTQIEGLFANPSTIESTEKIQNIFMFLHRCEGLSKHVDTFTQMLSLMQLKEGVPFILAPLVPDDLNDTKFLSDCRSMDLFYDSNVDDFDTIVAEMEKEISMADVMKELGYGCTISASKCKEILSLFMPLTEASIARILGIVVRSYAGLEDNTTTFSSFLSAIGSNPLSDLPYLSSWDVNILVETIKQLAPETNWAGVMENLDHEGFYIPNENAFTFFMTIYKHACQDSFPLHAICGSVWKNSEGQLSFLKYAVSAPPEVFTFAHSIRQLVYVDSVHGLQSQPGQSNYAWLCLDLVDVLCQLAERGHAATIQAMLEYPLKNCPEVLLLGVAQIHTTYNLLQHEVASTVLPMIIANAGRKGVILHLWHINHYLVLRGFVHVLASESDGIHRILDVCQETKILSQVLERIPFSFAIKLAVVASQKELLDLEKWLNDNLMRSKDTFFKECFKYIKEVQSQTISEENADKLHETVLSANPGSRSALVILKVLQANAHIVTSKSLCDEIEKMHASLMNGSLAPQNEGVADSPSSNTPSDIDAEANSYFQHMFSEKISVADMVIMLTRFKESSDKRELSIFECMIANLFEEYRFFPKYPERQLGIAAELFGSIIKHQLVTHLTLGIALRCVLDALRKPADSKMFTFGTKALDQFLNRLDEWPQYCNHILQISHLRGTNQDLVVFIEAILSRQSHGGNGPVDQLNITSLGTTGNEITGLTTTQLGQPLSSPPPIQPRPPVQLDDGNKASLSMNSFTKPLVAASAQSTATTLADAVSIPKIPSPLTTPGMLSSSQGYARTRGVTNARFGSALNIETLLAASERRETPIEAPSSEAQDKISFIFNNISASTMDAKAKEFSEILKEECYPWFAQYMVMKRASIEPNFHEMYLKFLDKINSKALYKEIVQETYENCKVLLGSELIKSSSEERSLLKNLGSWLGKLTIGRNQVLRARDIDPKSLIIEAYEKGLMIAVIPFTSKILEPCQSSLAYQPPNPWTMGILALLAEIYAMPNLKMNLKFDIEVLFKNLGVQIKEVTPTSLLRDRVRVVEGNPDFSNKEFVAPQQPISSEDQVAIPEPMEPPPKPQLPVPISPYVPAEDDKGGSMGFSDQLPSAQGLLQSTGSQSQYSMTQLPPSIPSLGAHVVVNSKLNNMGLHVHFQRVLPLAMDRAIKEIVPGIVQRSVSIATQTTKELVIKDYALESDESRIYNAAHLMVASLSGSLAHVTCKEPLRGSITSQLRNMLQGVNVGSEVLEQYVQLVTNDNLDLGCAMIEQAAQEKAVQTIDAEISQQLSLRRKHRESLGSSIYDANIYAQGAMGILPETLRPTPGRLSVSQQRVYEDFVRLPWQNQQSSQSANATLAAHPPSPSPAGGSFPRTFSASSGQLSSNIYSGLGNTSFGVGAQPIDLVSDEMEPSSQILSTAAPSQIRTESVGSQRPENDSTPVSSSGVSAVEPLPIESAASMKEPGVSSQSQPQGSVPIGTGLLEPSLTIGDVLDKYQLVALKLETALASDGREAEIQPIVSEIPQIILRCGNRDEAALAVAQKVFKSLYENSGNGLHIAAHLAILAAIRDVCKLVVKELSSWLIYSDEERKFNKDITVGLIRRELLNLAEYNIHMAKLLDAGRNKIATEFAVSLLQTLVKEEPKVISELQNLVENLAKQLAARPGSPELLQQLVETVKNPAANVGGLTSPSTGKDDKNRQTRDQKVSQSVASKGEYNSVEVMEPDASSFQKQVSLLFAEWYRLSELPSGTDTPCIRFVIQLHQNGLLRGDDITERFFRVLLEISVSHFGEVMQSSQQVQSSFLAIDIYAKLVYSILKHCPVDQGSSKLFLLPKILAVTVRSIQKDADEKKEDFNPRPYYRLFINWLLDFGSLDPVHDGINFQVLSAFANAFHALQPLKVPAFSFAWLELVSHRTFMPKLLAGNSQKGWPFLHRLLVDLFQFMEPFLRNAEMGELIRFLYQGTLRVLLVLLHDFPEFLCDFHFSFCDVIPPSCIQMRNIILSAFPRNMRLPDPSTPNLKIDLLDEMSLAPRILSEVDAALKAKQMKADVDEFLRTRQQSSPFLSDLKQRLLLPPSEASHAGTCYNVPLINSLVLYVGMQAIQLLQARNRSQPQSVSSDPLAAKAALDIFQTLIRDLDTEGRYLFLNAIANQLRYPNTHTHYFSVILLYLFSDAHQEIIQEQITRVLLERLIVNRPHPWGLLITFIELIKNPDYNFWNRTFTRCAPEIENLFETVSTSCGGPKPGSESMVGSGGLSDSAH
ncbi:CCR4-NOT transcription complex subunit 1-like isoform X1 [Chenopodium quinoa]|uniref:CCR4-NOT transcription complex subunit 1-like isoform X1 n=1 Tax=Chenopodium quinoa TaxID=63459 RepID=UPI000B78CBC4|nr:CCR4-NOT transcription complex subunit 1-like isoform X1 [Chenopodium quinoa]